MNISLKNLDFTKTFMSALYFLTLTRMIMINYFLKISNNKIAK